MTTIVLGPDGSTITQIPDGAQDIDSTSLTLLGAGAGGLEQLNEDLVRLLINSADAEPPAYPRNGQLWYDTANAQLNLYADGQWVALSSPQAIQAIAAGQAAAAAAPLQTAIAALEAEVTSGFQEANGDIQQSKQDIATLQTNASSAFAELQQVSTVVYQIQAIGGDGANAALTVETAARVSGDEALAGEITTLTASVSGPDSTSLQSQITNEAVVRADGDSALAATLTSLTSTVTGPDSTSIQSQIAQESITRATADEALTGQVNQLTSTVSGPESTSIQSQITEEATTRATNDDALATTINTLTASVSGPASTSLQSQITNEQTVRSGADQALAASITDLTTTVSGAGSTSLQSQITQESLTRSTAIDTVTGEINTLTSTISGPQGTSVQSQINQEAATRAGADGALSILVTNLTAATTGSGGNSLQSQITNQTATQATATQAVAQTVTNLTAATTGSGGSSLQSQITATNSTVSTLSGTTSSQITTLQSQVTTNPNLLPNGGFTNGLQDWTAAYQTSTSSSAGTFQHAGLGQLGYVNALLTQAAGGLSYLTSAPIPAIPGQTYTISGNYQASVVGGGSIGYTCLNVYFLDTNRNYLGGDLTVASYNTYVGLSPNTPNCIGQIVIPPSVKGTAVGYMSVYLNANWTNATPNTSQLQTDFNRIKVEYGSIYTGWDDTATQLLVQAQITSEQQTRAFADNAIAQTVTNLTAATTGSGGNSLQSQITTTNTTVSNLNSTTATSLTQQQSISNAGTGYLNNNPTFAIWTGASGTIPDCWQDLSSAAGHTQKVQGLISNNGLNFDCTGGLQNTNVGIQQLGRTPGGGPGLYYTQTAYYVIELDALIGSGDFTGVCVQVTWYSGSDYSQGNGYSTIVCSQDPDTQGVTGAGGIGRRTWSKLVDNTYGSAAQIQLFANYNGFTAYGNSNVTFYKCGLRPATVLEAQIGQTLTNANQPTFSALINSIQTSSTSSSQAVASSLNTLQTQMAGNSSSYLLSQISNNSQPITNNYSTQNYSIQTLTSQMAGNQNSGLLATVQTQANSIANLNGNVYGSYGFSVNSDGSLAQMLAYASNGPSGPQSGIVFEANSLMIKTSGQSATQIFKFQGSTLTAPSLVVQNANIGTAAIGTLNLGTGCVTQYFYGGSSTSTTIGPGSGAAATTPTPTGGGSGGGGSGGTRGAAQN